MRASTQAAISNLNTRVAQVFDVSRRLVIELKDGRIAETFEVELGPLDLPARTGGTSTETDETLAEERRP